MFTVHYINKNLSEGVYKCDTLKEARAFARSLREVISVEITDGDKEYDVVKPELH
ncbi:hypothetical protein Mangalitsa_003 [Escherichia phage Mangalitsa]|uniref:Uncharacterized protein n=1 Tax=Escherichia phage Mangalitsa TaxID=2589658 RepID=A0A5B9N4W6_9CAUD|nr:hypothetical protein HWC55_gp03 [Escherichia phage Mangalitsa]QEG07805.1 hypothetical protein Mangalitsa_003 [Escherichia phage Mangalitsa]